MRTRTSPSRKRTVSTATGLLITGLLISAGKLTPTYCLRDGWLSRGDVRSRPRCPRVDTASRRTHRTETAQLLEVWPQRRGAAIRLGSERERGAQPPSRRRRPACADR